MLRKLWGAKLVRFVSVGVFNTILDISILNTLVFLGHLPTLIANLVSASTSIVVSYFLNHHFVFRSHENHSFTRFTKFFLVTGVGILAIQTLIIYLVTHLLSHQHASVVSILHVLHISRLGTRAFDLNAGKLSAVLVAMIWNFTIYHFVIFKKPGQEPDIEVLL